MKSPNSSRKASSASSSFAGILLALAYASCSSRAAVVEGFPALAYGRPVSLSQSSGIAGGREGFLGGQGPRAAAFGFFGSSIDIVGRSRLVLRYEAKGLSFAELRLGYAGSDEPRVVPLPFADGSYAFGAALGEGASLRSFDLRIEGGMPALRILSVEIVEGSAVLGRGADGVLALVEGARAEFSVSSDLMRLVFRPEALSPAAGDSLVVGATVPSADRVIVKSGLSAWGLRGSGGAARVAFHPESLDSSSFVEATFGPGPFSIEWRANGGLPALSDWGPILNDKRTVESYLAYRWDAAPSILILDFKDYSTQDRYLKRLAFFAEKAGFRGRIAAEEEVAGLHAWNAHDYPAATLAAFFSLAESASIPLNGAERDLEALLVAIGVLRREGGSLVPGDGAIVSIARESPPSLRRTFAMHETAHAVWFVSPSYRASVSSAWSSFDEAAKALLVDYFVFMRYDVNDPLLLENEFQAYLVQQAPDACIDYFGRLVPERLSASGRDRAERYASWDEEEAGPFLATSVTLSDRLESEFGIGSGEARLAIPVTLP